MCTSAWIYTVHPALCQRVLAGSVAYIRPAATQRDRERAADQQRVTLPPCEWDEMWEIRRQLGEALMQQLELNCSVLHWAPCGTVSGVCAAIFTVLGGKGYRGEPPWTQSSCANTGRELIVFIFNKGRVYNPWLLTCVPTLSFMQGRPRQAWVVPYLQFCAKVFSQSHVFIFWWEIGAVIFLNLSKHWWKCS